MFLFCFVLFCFVPFRSVPFRSVSFRFVSFRFLFVAAKYSHHPQTKKCLDSFLPIFFIVFGVGFIASCAVDCQFFDVGFYIATCGFGNAIARKFSFIWR